MCLTAALVAVLTNSQPCFHFVYSDEASNGDILGTHLALDDGGFTVMLDYVLSGFDSNPAKYD